MTGVQTCALPILHAGEKRIPPEVAAELAEHAGDEALSSRVIEVLSLISEGNANKSRNVSCATQPAQSSSPEVGQRSKPKTAHPLPFYDSIRSGAAPDRVSCFLLAGFPKCGAHSGGVSCMSIDYA